MLNVLYLPCPLFPEVIILVLFYDLSMQEQGYTSTLTFSLPSATHFQIITACSALVLHSELHVKDKVNKNSLRLNLDVKSTFS